MHVLNRTAVVVTAKQPFLDWLRSVDPASHNLTLEDLNREPSVYLVPSSDRDDAAARYVRKLSGEIFAEELDGWWRDPSVWPTDLGFRVFARWFDCRYHSLVFDLAKSELMREEA